MPTENEMKFVLALDSEQEVRRMAEAQVKIWQGYLLVGRGFSLRFRKAEQAKKVTHVMAFKCSAGGRVIEIEKKIDERDFNDLWPQCLNKLEKRRFLLKSYGGVWEIDYFKDHNNHTYFAMAEFEMPEGKARPDYLPKIIVDHLVFEVPLTDCRFSSKLLADVRYAVKLHQSLREKSNV